jgi:ATP-dependent protease ClpP protease subunit
MFNSKKRKTNNEDPLQHLKMMMSPCDLAEKEKNHIYFYTEVNQETCLDLSRKINDLGKELLKFSIEYDIDPPNIYLHINSLGGDLLSAFGVVDTIINSSVPIISIIEGQVASASTIIAMVCDKRYMTENSYLLIHQLSTEIYGTYQQIKDNFINDTKFMERLYKLYKNYTKMSEKKIKEVLSHDIWWDYKECIVNGLVDGLWETTKKRKLKK